LTIEFSTTASSEWKV